MLVPLLAATTLVACGGDNKSSVTSANGSGTSGTTQPAATTGSEPAATTAAPGTTAAPASTAPGNDPCDPIGTLTTLDLNDRCLELDGADWSKEFAPVLLALGYWVDQSCPNGALVVAQPNEVLVAVSDPGQLDASVTQVLNKLQGSAADTDFKTGLSQVIDVKDVDVDGILKQLPSLQGQGYSTDLNYLEPVQPNYGFRPAGDPQPAAGNQVPDTPGAQGAPSILVLDSTDDTSLYDVDGNGFVDEDHGHGVFVRSIIQREAPGAAVTLQAVTSTANRLASGRWIPMMFSDADLLAAMEPHFGSVVDGRYVIDKSFDAVNLSLGGAGCTTSGFGYGVGERVALARAMDAFWEFDTSLRFVAAAGNDSGYDRHLEFKHFPAAWRDQTATENLATQVDGANPGNAAPGSEIRQIHERLANAMVAVAASDGLDYTNCGDWINAVARGSETGNYGPGLATWRGTSFATANESALVASGQLPNDSFPCPPPLTPSTQP